VDDFSKYIASKCDFYDAMVANGYCLPKYKSTMILEDYMRDIFGGRPFCSHYKDVKLLPCPRPPPVKLLLRKFHRICESPNLLNNCGIDELRLPDKRYLLDFVSTFRPDDEIFRKDYRPPARAHKLSEMKTVDINERFNEHRISSRRKFLRELFHAHYQKKHFLKHPGRKRLIKIV
jgi:hypothetical protein